MRAFVRGGIPALTDSGNIPSHDNPLGLIVYYSSGPVLFQGPYDVDGVRFRIAQCTKENLDEIKLYANQATRIRVAFENRPTIKAWARGRWGPRPKLPCFSGHSANMLEPEDADL